MTLLLRMPAKTFLRVFYVGFLRTRKCGEQFRPRSVFSLRLYACRRMTSGADGRRFASPIGVLSNESYALAAALEARTERPRAAQSFRAGRAGPKARMKST